MKKLILYSFSFVLGIAALCSCGSKNKEKVSGVEAYKKSLNDSIRACQTEIDSCNEQISILRDKVGSWMHEFVTVTYPSGNGGYIILASAKNLYPMKSSGLIARVSTSGKFELIAALAGKKFDRITVEATGQSASSSIIASGGGAASPQGLVSAIFVGEKAAAIGKLIADNELNPITVIYEKDGSEVQRIDLSNEYAKVVSMTYLFYQDNYDMKILEKKVPLLNAKIDLIRQHLNKFIQRENVRSSSDSTVNS